VSDSRPLRVFISYSHDDRPHADRVAALSNRLRADGIDCRIDQYDVRPPEGWPDWMERQIDEADTVLIVCTEIYRERFERKQPPTIGRGVRWESLLTKNHIYRDGAVNEKFMPVLFGPDDEQHIPQVLYGFEYARVDPDDLDGNHLYAELLRKIRFEPPRPMPPLGPGVRGWPEPAVQRLPTLSVQEAFFQPGVSTGEVDELLVQLHGLPSSGPEMFGRDAQLRRLDEAWQDEHSHVITLVAFGGVGKTALVNHWLAQMAAEDFRGARRVYGWSAYSQGTKQRATAADQFIDQALRFFGDEDPEAGLIDQRAGRLAELVRRQPTLLVLDGIEPLQHAPGEGEGHIKDVGLRTLVRELAARNRGLCVITTRLGVSDLGAYEKTTCSKIDLEDLQPADGARLLEALGAVGTEKERETASEEFAGHALALTLLGTFLRDAFAGDIRRRREIGPLVYELKNGGHARRVMDSYEAWLGEGPERAILRMLGLFDRPAEAGAIAALRRQPPIAGLTDGLDKPAWQNALIRLRHARLLSKADAAEPGALDAHPLVREHFGEKLRHEHARAWRAGHDRLFEYYRGDGCKKWLPDTLDEMAPLFAAVIHGCAAGRHQVAFDEVFWSRIQRHDEFFSSKKLGAFGSELAALSGFFDPPWSAPVGGLSDADKSFLLTAAGFDLRALGRLAEAVEPIVAGQQNNIAREDWINAAIQAGNLSELHLTLGRVKEAIRFARQSVDYADRSGDAFLRIVMRTALADALHQAGRLDEAEDLFRQAEAMEKDDQPQYPLLYSVQGYRYCDLLLGFGRHEDVLKRAAQTLEWVTAQNWLLDIGLDHLSLARAALLAAESGRASAVAEARTHARAAVDTLRQAGTQHHLPRGLLGRAEVSRFDGRPDDARADLEEAMGIATRDPAGPMKLHMTDIHLAHARLDLDAARPDAARAHLAAARALIAQTGYHRRDAELAALSVAAGIIGNAERRK